MFYIAALLGLTKEERKVYKELDDYTADKFLALSHQARGTFMTRRAAIQAEQEQEEAKRLAEEFYCSEPEPDEEDDECENDDTDTEEIPFEIGWHVRETGRGCYHACNNASAAYYRMKQLEDKTEKLSEIIKHINSGGNVSIRYGQDSSYRIEKTDDLMCELLHLLSEEMYKTNSEFWSYRPVPYPNNSENK